MENPTTPVAERELFAHVDWVRHLARNLVDDPHTAEDVEQETWKRALEDPPRHRSNLRGWLGSVARNTARQWGRSQRARSGRERLAARPEATSSSDVLLAEAQIHRELVERVIALDEIHRSALILRYFRELSVPEVAQALDVPLNTARSRIARGLGKLRGELDHSHGRERWSRALLPAGAAGASGLRVSLGVVAVVLLGAVSVPLYLTVRSAPMRDARVAKPMAIVPELELARPEVPAESSASRERTASAVEATVPSRARGRLELQVVGTDGTPQAELDYLVFTERGGNRVRARGRTDEQGRAVLADLEENTYLIRTTRRPPHATGFRAVWIGENESKQVRMQLTEGGNFTGSVVDERGLPRPDIEVWARSRLEESAAIRFALEKVGNTDAEGKYRVDHVLSAPSGVWIVDGEERPEKWSQVSISLRDPRFGTWSALFVSGHSREGETQALEPKVFPRAIRYSGVLRGDNGEPVVRALVSAFPQRKSRLVDHMNPSEDKIGVPPWTAGFETFPGECLTDGQGRFTFDRPWPRRQQENQAVVWTQQGIVQSFPLPALEPGDHLDDLELELSSQDLLVIELQDESGHPWRLPSEQRPGAVPGGTGPFRILNSMTTLHAQLHFEGGSAQNVWKKPDGDELLRISLDQPLEKLRHVTLLAPDRLPATRALPGGWDSKQALPLQLRPAHRILLEASFEAAEPDVEPPDRVYVLACLLSPEERPQTKSRPTWWSCCGLGSFGYLYAKDDWKGLELSVQAQAPYWIYASERQPDSRVPPTSFGPFQPGERVHPILLPVEGVEREPEAQKEPPPLRQAGEPSSSLSALKSLGYVGGHDSAQEDEERTHITVVKPDGSVAAGTTLRFSNGESIYLDNQGQGELSNLQGREDLTFFVPLGNDHYAQGKLSLPDHLDEELSLELPAWVTVDLEVRGIAESHRFCSLQTLVQGSAFAASGNLLRYGTNYVKGLEILNGTQQHRTFRSWLTPGQYEVSSYGNLCTIDPVSITVGPEAKQSLSILARRTSR